MDPFKKAKPWTCSRPQPGPEHSSLSFTGPFEYLDTKLAQAHQSP